VFRNPDLAGTLELIARDGASAVYQGPIGGAIARDNEARGGFLTADDFAAHRADWVDPISSTYRGFELYELPPNTQGFVALEMLNILEGYDVASLGHNSADYLHRLAEAKRIAFADRGAFLADPALVPTSALAALISKEYAATRRREIDAGRVSPQVSPAAAFAGRDRGDTVYLAAADGQGNVISFINSLFSDFGSGIVTPGTGVMLHNRGLGFTLEQGHPNCLAAGKRPLHTLVPAFLMKDGKPLMAFGVMGGDNQAQAHAQIVVNIVDFGMNVQEAGDAPRVRHLEEGLAVERGIAPDVLKSLHARGHVLLDGRGAVGGYQAVMIDPLSGVLMGGSDPRKDGQAVGY
jgi:gamma-glutamyltranspeptidase/glutathione hydrolase